MKKLIDKIIFYASIILIIYFPLQPLLENILQYKFLFSPANSFWISHFYEPVIAILVLLAIVNFAVAKPRPKLNYAALSFTAFGVISVFLISQYLSRGIEGFKIDILPIILFLVVATARFEKKQFGILIKTYLIMASILALWAIFERLLPLNYWESLGFGRFGYGEFGFGRFSFGPLFQSVSLIGWPNQLASYLLPAFFLALFQKPDRQKYFLISIFTLAIVLTFSRGAWLGLAVSLVLYFVLFVQNRKVKITALLSFAALILVIGIVYLKIPAAKNIFEHTSSASAISSQQGHLSALSSTLVEIKSRLHEPKILFLGSGLGMAGPLVLKYGDGFVPESWYFQLLLETGVLGLVLWLWFLYTLLAKSYRENRGLFLALIAISITSLFLHTWADNPALAFTILLLLGVISNLKSQKPNLKDAS